MNARAPTTPSGTLRSAIESIALIALLVTLLVLLFDWNWFKRPIERHVSALTGRTFVIEGKLRGHIGRTLTLYADAVRLGNVEWSGEREMARAQDVAVSFEWRPLLQRELVVPLARAEYLDLRLERDKDGRANWELPHAKVNASVDSLKLKDGTLTVRDEPLRTDLQVDVHTGVADKAGEPPPVLIAGTGKYRGAPFSVQGTVESPLALRDTKAPYHVDLRALAADTHFHARGELIAPMQFRGFDLLFSMAGPNLARLYPLLGLALPESPPYALDGHLTHEGDEWHYHDFRGTVGDSDLAGNADFDVGGARPRLVADMRSRRLDLDDLAGFVGKAPDPTEKSNPQQRREAAEEKASPRLLPDTKYDVAKLRAMDADIRLRARKVNAPPWPLEDMDAHLVLDDGHVVVDPLAVGVANGRLAGRLELDARPRPIAASAKLRARNLELPDLFTNPLLATSTAGRVGVNVDLAGRGDSIAAIAATSSGNLGLIMGEGKISNLVMELAGLDVYESLKFMLGKDKIIPIRCAYADFTVDDGLMDAKSLVFDTTDTLIVGDGSASLRDEALALRLRAKPKDFSPLAFRAPLKLTGSFKSPHLGPEKGPITLRAAATVALHALAPPAALLALFDKGSGKDADCDVRFARK